MIKSNFEQLQIKPLQKRADILKNNAALLEHTIENIRGIASLKNSLGNLTRTERKNVINTANVSNPAVVSTTLRINLAMTLSTLPEFQGMSGAVLLGLAGWLIETI